MSTTSREANFERIEDEASVWAARLRGGAMTDADRGALAAWLQRDPEHQWVLSRYRELTGQLDVQLGAADEVAQARAPDRRRLWWAALSAAAAIALLAVVWVGRAREFETNTAERHAAALADGSRVELNARTALTVDFSRGERHVRLAHGEALFSVAKDAARPFVIDTPAGTVRVTGTIFNVRATPVAGVEVTVLEGTVQVHAAGASAPKGNAALTPGAQAVMISDRVEVHTLPEEAIKDVTAWREGRVVFTDTPLADAVERFAGYHARTLTVDPSAADLRLGGRFSLDDLEGFLDFAQRVLPVKIARVGGAVTISRVTEK